MSNSSPVSIQLPFAQRCNHINGRGRRCRMFVADAKKGLCPHHLVRLQAERAKNDEALAELRGPLEDFSSPANVNFFLGNLLKLKARKRIDRRDALATGLHLPTPSQHLSAHAPGASPRRFERSAIVGLCSGGSFGLRLLAEAFFSVCSW